MLHIMGDLTEVWPVLRVVCTKVVWHCDLCELQSSVHAHRPIVEVTLFAPLAAAPATVALTSLATFVKFVSYQICVFFKLRNLGWNLSSDSWKAACRLETQLLLMYGLRQAHHFVFTIC